MRVKAEIGLAKPNSVSQRGCSDHSLKKRVNCCLSRACCNMRIELMMIACVWTFDSMSDHHSYYSAALPPSELPTNSSTNNFHLLNGSFLWWGFEYGRIAWFINVVIVPDLFGQTKRKVVIRLTFLKPIWLIIYLHTNNVFVLLKVVRLFVILSL